MGIFAGHKGAAPHGLWRAFAVAHRLCSRAFAASHPVRYGSFQGTVFGSLARGTATEDSDADVMVISGERLSSQRWLDRQDLSQRVVAAAGLPFSCDLLVWTREEQDRARATKNGLLAEIEEQGVVIYER